MFQVDHIIYYYGTYCRQLIVNAMTYGRTLLFQLVLIRFLVCKEAPEISSSEFYTSGQTCSFKETAGKKGMESLWITSGNMTADVDGCKTLCSTTELCIAGEFHSTTKTCHMYSLETSLTAQADIVFFQWNIDTGTDDGSTPVAAIVVGVIICVAAVCGAVIVVVVLWKRSKKEQSRNRTSRKSEG
ncbi:uncharacterized protein LOC124270614 isoform X10 [Haliotis rubra]|uniref:uncharacterized protein LOC124270614 isoform X10 n=1 Tax=Haliotis rubra TaxID=36100 RepID=UPI001EE5436B|nr:uncharacterized protein LOC124270614 isoform X10 [Haliotis rubra]